MCTRVYVLLYEGKCKWSYGPSCPVDFLLNIFVRSFVHLFIQYYTTTTTTTTTSGAVVGLWSRDQDIATSFALRSMGLKS